MSPFSTARRPASLTTVLMIVTTGYAALLGIAVGSHPALAALMLMPFAALVSGVAVDAEPRFWVAAAIVVDVMYAGLMWAGRPSLGSFTVDPSDVLALVGLSWALWSLAKYGTTKVKVPVTLLIMLLLVTWPVAVGMVRGQSIQGILRDAKPMLYYGTALVFVVVAVRMPHIDFAAGWLALATSLAGAFHVMAILAGWGFESGMSGVELTTGTVSRGFGLYSAYSLYGAVGLWLALGDTEAPRWKKGGQRLVGSVLIGLMVATLIRSLLIGAAVALVLALVAGRRLLSRNALTWLVVSVGMAGVASVVIASLAGIPATGLLERASSIFASSASSSGAALTRDFRVTAVTTTLAISLRFPFGIGYGDILPTAAAGLPAGLVLQYSTHSTLGWLLLRTGIVGTLIATFAFALMVRDVFSHPKISRGGLLFLMLLGSYVGESVGANTLFNSQWTMGVIMLAIAYVYRDALGLEENRE